MVGALAVALLLVPSAGAPAAQSQHAETVIEQGPSGTTRDSDAVFVFSASAPDAGFHCALDGEPLDMGGPGKCTSPASFQGLADGEHTFYVQAVGPRADQNDPDGVSRTWTVDSDATSDSYEGTAPAGGTVSSDPAGEGASADDPLTTGVTVPAGGSVSITEQPVTTAAPEGFAMLGREARVTAPDASAAEPLRLVFALDASAIPPDEEAAAVTVLRDGAPVASCTETDAAVPDPCVSDRRTLADGDLQLTVLSSRASTWSFAVEDEAPPPGGGGGGSPPSGEPLGLEGLVRQLLGLVDELTPVRLGW